MSQKYEYVGTVVEVGNTQTFPSGFSKRELIVSDDLKGKYPSFVKFTFAKDRTAYLDKLKKGDRVTVSFFVSGRRWDGPKGAQYFVDLAASSVKVAGSDADGQPGSLSVPPPADPSGLGETAEEEMPF